MNVTKCLARVPHLLLAMIAGTSLAVSATAQTVLIDFGSAASFRGVSVTNPDVNGNYWTSIPPGTPVVNAIDIAGNPTVIDMYFDTGVGTDSYNGPAGPTSFPNPTPAEIALTDIDPVALGNLGIKEAAIDFAAADSGAVRFQLQELDPTKKYNLAFYGSHKFSNDDTTRYSVYTDSDYDTLVATTTLDVQTPGMPWLHNRDTVAKLYGLSPQASNILYVEFNGANGGFGYLNAFRIEVVPEPCTVWLLLAGVGVVFGWRRR